jgi:hypothetical protein
LPNNDLPESEKKMVRRSAGFVSKKPHRKSRGGCLVCKRKRVKVMRTPNQGQEHVITGLSAMKVNRPVDIAHCDD